VNSKGKHRAECLYEIRLDHILCLFMMILCIFSTESKLLAKQCKMQNEWGGHGTTCGPAAETW